MEHDELEPARVRARGLGYIPDEDESDDVSAAAHFGALYRVSRDASLRAHVTSVRDQGPTSSCVGQAVAAAVDIRRSVLGKPAAPSSAAGIYALARAYGSTGPLVDEGSSPRAAFRAVKEWGVPTRPDFDAAAVNAPIQLGDLQSATTLGSWYRIDASGRGRTAAVMQAIDRGYPVVFAIQVDDAFDNYKAGDPPLRACGEPLGGHMLAAIGYQSTPDGVVFEVLNSWGPDWGEHGFCRMHRERIEDPTTRDLFVLVLGAVQ